MDKADHGRTHDDAAAQLVDAQSQSLGSLKPKGACWYCNQPVDNVRRFCNKTCADDYRTEEETFSTEPR
jgi:hypothetical protein